MLEDIFSWLLDWIYPPTCMVCRQILPPFGHKWFCDDCADVLQPIKPPICEKCGCPIETTDSACPGCRRRPRLFESNTAIFLYDEIVRELIHQFKYGNQSRYGYGFALLMAKYAPPEIWRTDALVPVPMFRKKQRRRGYNQAQVLAEKLSRQTGIPTETDLLLRVKNTKPQSALGPADREHNVRDAFALTSAARKKKQANAKSFLLIDDIYTTGETLSACAKVLLDNGAACVRGLTLAIAAGQSDNK